MDLPNEIICLILSNLTFDLDDLRKYLTIPILSSLLSICVKKITLTGDIQASKLRSFRKLSKIKGGCLVVDDTALLHQLTDYVAVFPDKESCLLFIKTVDYRHFHRGYKRIRYIHKYSDARFVEMLMIEINNGQLVQDDGSIDIDQPDLDVMLLSILVTRQMFTSLTLFMDSTIPKFLPLFEQITSLEKLTLIIEDSVDIETFLHLRNIWKLPHILEMDFYAFIGDDHSGILFALSLMTRKINRLLKGLPILPNIRSFLAPMSMTNIMIAKEIFPNLNEAGIYAHYYRDLKDIYKDLEKLKEFQQIVIYHQLEEKMRLKFEERLEFNSKIKLSQLPPRSM